MPTHHERSRVIRRLAVCAAVLVYGCNSGVGPSGEVLIELTGRIERSGVVGIHATRLGLPFVGNDVAWSVMPGDAAEFLPGDQVRLIRATRVTFTVTGGGLRGDFAVDVPAPPTIVFDLTKNGNRDIYRAALDGLDTVRLTTRAGDDINPTAAAGNVVYVSFGDGNGELYSVPLTGGMPVRLTNTTINEADPALSPDGQSLAFTRAVAGVSKLFTSAADGSGAAQATLGFGFAGSVEAGPSWSPAGDRLVFMSTNNGDADLFTYTRATGAVDPLLVDSDSADVEPAWSHDGGLVAFASTRGNGDTEIYVLNLQSQQVTPLTNRVGTDGAPAWLADGRLIYVEWTSPTAARLRWIDPATPATVHDIDIGPGLPGHPSGVAP